MIVDTSAIYVIYRAVRVTTLYSATVLILSKTKKQKQTKTPFSLCLFLLSIVMSFLKAWIRCEKTGLFKAK